MKFTCGTVTDRGLNPKRAANEDRFLTLKESELFLVADGVGGRRGGQVASQTVVDVFTEMFTKRPAENVALAVEAAVIESNRRVFAASLENTELEGMATTVVVLAIDGEEAIIGHVGDSRAYRFERGVLYRETEDHSEVGEAVRAGVISPAMAAYDPMRNVLTRAVGAEPDIEADFKTIRLTEGARFLLCSDGITRHVTDRALSDLLSTSNHPETICQILKQRCFADGAEDNLTAVIVDCGELRYQDTLDEGLRQSPDASPTGRRIEVDLNRPSTNHAAGAAPVSIETTRESPPPNRRGAKLRAFVALLAVAAAGVGIGRYYEPIKLWVETNVLARFVPDEKTAPAPAPNPSIPDPDLAAARVLFEEKRYEKAREQLIELKNRSPERAQYHLWLGLTEYELKNYDEAIKDLNEAARLDSRLPDVYAHLARAYGAIGDRRKMEESLRRGRAR